MKLHQRIKQIAAPSGADFEPKYTVSHEGLVIGATNVVDSIKFDASDLAADHSITLFEVPKDSIISDIFMYVNTKSDNTVQIGDGSTVNLFVTTTTVNVDDKLVGADPEELGEALAIKNEDIPDGGEGTNDIFIKKRYLVTTDTDIVATFNAAPTNGVFTAFVSYLRLAEPIEEQEYATKPSETPYFRIREDDEYYS